MFDEYWTTQHIPRAGSKSINQVAGAGVAPFTVIWPSRQVLFACPVRSQSGINWFCRQCPCASEPQAAWRTRCIRFRNIERAAARRSFYVLDIGAAIPLANWAAKKDSVALRRTMTVCPSVCLSLRDLNGQCNVE